MKGTKTMYRNKISIAQRSVVSLLFLVVGTHASSCSRMDPIPGQDGPTQELMVDFPAGSQTAYGSAVLDLGRAKDHVKDLYLKKDSGVDFIDLTAKHMTVKEYAGHINTTLVADGHTHADHVPVGADNAADILVVVAFKTHSRIERLGVHQFLPNDDAATSASGYLSPVDGLMGVVHAFDARTLAEHNTILYTSGQEPDYLVNLIRYNPLPFSTAKP